MTMSFFSLTYTIFFFLPLDGTKNDCVLHGLLGRAHGFGMEKIGAANGGEKEKAVGFGYGGLRREGALF